jgi:hypothetical protein
MDNNLRLEEVCREDWLEIAHCFRDYNFRQTWEFGKACAERVGAVSRHVVLRSSIGNVVACADVRIRKLPLIGGGKAYINGGPLTCNNDKLQQNTLCTVLLTLVDHFVLGQNLSLRILPPFIGFQQQNDWITALSKCGFYEH